MSVDALLEVANHAVTHNKVFCLNLSAPFLIQFFQVCSSSPRVKCFSPCLVFSLFPCLLLLFLLLFFFSCPLYSCPLCLVL